MSETVHLSDEERGTIDEFVDVMMGAGKSSKQDDFYEAFASGKGCEQAVVNLLNDKHGIGAEVDYEVYHGSDNSDILPYQAEVKSIVGHGSRLAIPTDECSSIGEDEPIIGVKWHSLSKFEVVGWCYKDDLTFVEQGAKPWTQVADNLVTHVDNLNDDWYSLAQEMGADPAHGSTDSSCSSSQSRFTFSTE